MRQLLTPQRDVVIFDCDGVFYSWNALGGMDAAKLFYAESKANVVPRLLPSLSREQAATIGAESYAKTGDGLAYFVPIAKEQGYDEVAFRDELHTLYHTALLLDIRRKHPQVLLPCTEMLHYLNELRHVRMGILSQSCRQSWLLPLAEEKLILNLFNPAHLFGFKEFDWHEKSQSARGLGMIMKAMGVDPARVVFVEDTKQNLRPVKREYPHVLTVHLTDWQTTEPEDTYVDLSFPSLLGFLRDFHEIHRSHTPDLRPRADGLRFQP